MEFHKYLHLIKAAYEAILVFIDQDEQTIDESQLSELFKQLDISNDKEALSRMIQILISISLDHRQKPDFFNRIHSIIALLSGPIKKTFDNREIFELFKWNKVLLLYVIEQGLVKIDKSISDEIVTTNLIYDINYKFYFYPEIKDYLDSKELSKFKAKLPKYDEFEFKQEREKGVKNDELMQIIRLDLIDKFTEKTNAEDRPFNFETEFCPSLFETNRLLNESEVSLTEYALFYGSSKIVDFLFRHKYKMNSSVWLYAVHSNNPYIMSLLMKQKIDYESPVTLLEESIRCHHSEAAKFILEKMINDEDRRHEIETRFFNSPTSFGFQYNNFSSVSEDISLKSAFFYSCQYRYMKMFELLLNSKEIDINATIVFKYCIYRIHFQLFQ
ncbi:hypothetical protein M9Y10_005034 [Tritrichomonas musculus]|uniref:DUF3447 domain-containing protein n=1 Tax=Tritrichomonas musculus TaxID=1915356 RepID=A0ABR2JK44_9EUKA